MYETERAWAAGFHDGEGSAYLFTGNGAKGQLRVSVQQTDPEVLHRYQRAVGVGNVTGPYPRKAPRQGVYVFSASGDAAFEVYERLLPYLGSVKRRQFADAIVRTVRRPLGAGARGAIKRR